MGTTRQVSLSINDVAIELGYFVQEFIGHVISGMLAALKDTGEINSVSIAIEEDNVTINLNNTLVPTNPFASKIIRNTIIGMVSVLKGVREANRIDIKIER